jgi:hypothetical protein
MAEQQRCELAHERATKATIRIRVRSNRLNSAGRPLEIDLAICSSHARELRGLGIQLIHP